MKNTKRTMAAAAAALLASTMIGTTVFAQDPGTDPSSLTAAEGIGTAPDTAAMITHRATYDHSAVLAKLPAGYDPSRYEVQFGIIVPKETSCDWHIWYNGLMRLRQMRNMTIPVTISKSGMYALKSQKLYGRKAIGLDEKGDWILGKWECLYDNTDTGKITVSGDYVSFGLCADIVWGTDFPMAGEFWNKPKTRVREMELNMMGFVRSADFEAVVQYSHVDDYNQYIVWETVKKEDLPSHSEWKP